MTQRDRASVNGRGVPIRDGSVGSRLLSGWMRHVLAVGWLVGAALAVLAPVIAHGSSFGSFDTLSQFGVLSQHGTVVHNLQAGDQADQIVPWTTLAWRQVHNGQIPLWNPYSALGMPLTFNWQSASFSVPALIGYLFPQNLATTIQVILTLIIAGTGVYVLGRVLRLGVLASVFAATAFELSGPMVGWLSWIHAAAMSWAGWLFAAAILVLRGDHRARHVAFLALVAAAMIYQGSPEVIVLLGMSLTLFLIVVLARRLPQLGGTGPIRRPVFDLSVAFVAGGALGAPLLLPGAQLIAGSERRAAGDPAELISGNPPVPAHNLIHLIFQGFDGLPIAGNHWFGYVLGYSETALYVGVIVLVLAVVAVAIRHQIEVIGFGVLTVAMACVAFLPPLVAVLARLPIVGTVVWQRALLPLAFGLAVLGGVGMDALVKTPNRRRVLYWAGGGFAGAAIVLAALWAFGRGHLPPDESAIRASSFVWPAVQTAVGLAVVGGIVIVYRHGRPRRYSGASSGRVVGRGAGLVLLLCEAGFLVAAGAPLWTSSPTFFASTPEELAFKNAVGQSIVGYGAPLCFFPPGLGIPANAQIVYGVHEFALYDPMMPSAYFSSWRALTGQSGGNAPDSAFCPVVKTVDQARLYGVGFVLEPAGSPGPPGTEFATRIGHEDLYRVPGSGEATLTPLPPSGKPPAEDARGTPVAGVHPDPASWRIETDSRGSQLLRLRLTDVPGWHASVDGTPVALERFAGVMLQLKVPSGRHTVRLYYWPARFTIGLVLAACSAVGLVVAVVIAEARRRRRLPATAPQVNVGLPASPGERLPTSVKVEG